MADEVAREVEQTNETKSHAGGRTVAGGVSVDRARVPTMSVVEESATVEDLDVPFDEQVRDRILDDVHATELSADIRDIVEDDGVLGDRNLFTWKWEWYIFGEPLTLDCVADEYRREAQEAKTLVGLYVTLIDDVGEQLNDEATFWELAKTAYPSVDPDWDCEDIDSEYARSLRRVWTELMDRLESAPRYEDFVESFTFDLRASVQAMDYARLSADERALMNPAETWYFDTRAIGLYLFWTVDLMYSPEFERADFRAFRQVAYQLEHMWRLGNWIITWEREVHEHDYSAGIFVEALDQGIVCVEDLERVENGEMAPERLIGRIEASGIPEQFTADWKRRRDRLLERDFGMASLDSDELVAKMEWLMQSHLATEGYR